MRRRLILANFLTILVVLALVAAWMSQSPSGKSTRYPAGSDQWVADQEAQAALREVLGRLSKDRAYGIHREVMPGYALVPGATIPPKSYPILYCVSFDPSRSPWSTNNSGSTARAVGYRGAVVEPGEALLFAVGGYRKSTHTIQAVVWWPRGLPEVKVQTDYDRSLEGPVTKPPVPPVQPECNRVEDTGAKLTRPGHGEKHGHRGRGARVYC